MKNRGEVNLTNINWYFRSRVPAPGKRFIMWEFCLSSSPKNCKFHHSFLRANQTGLLPLSKFYRNVSELNKTIWNWSWISTKPEQNFREAGNTWEAAKNSESSRGNWTKKQNIGNLSPLTKAGLKNLWLEKNLFRYITF